MIYLLNWQIDCLFVKEFNPITYIEQQIKNKYINTYGILIILDHLLTFLLSIYYHLRFMYSK